MQVDVSGFLLAELRKTIGEHKRAIVGADNTAANEKARACASLCRQIAASSPVVRQRYTVEAERWESIASRSAPVAARRQCRASDKLGQTKP
ncbi:MAG: hypothetical protein PHS20_09655, partial [Sphaerochaetaceae bacterium]|nr:hypothetical protein [Sphaerochaetaceae bacterium]